MDLQEACGGDPRERRRQALAELAALAAERGGAAFEPPPEALILEDRERCGSFLPAGGSRRRTGSGA